MKDTGDVTFPPQQREFSTFKAYKSLMTSLTALTKPSPREGQEVVPALR